MDSDPQTRDWQRLVESTRDGLGADGGVPPGQQIGDYDVVELLGRGGMGKVFRARHRRTGREVALKLPEHGTNTGRRAERFRREGWATAALDHPNVVRVHELGVVGGTPFLAYELVEGARELDEVMPESSIRRRVELVRDAARGIGHAHSRGVLHRDVKGANLLVDAGGGVKVADFGLAQLVGLETLTQTGALVGTPRTMSPEQIAGDREQYGPPTDVWGLGVVLYEALTGEVPFDGGSLIELASAIHGERPPLPSALVAGLAPELDDVVLRALAKAPKDRYPDGDAMAAALDAVLELDELEGRAQRPRWSLLAGGVAIVAALGVGVGVLVQRGGEVDSEVPAQDPANAAADERKQRAAARALERLRTERSPRRKIEAADDWLERYPTHAAAREVTELRALAQLEVPLLDQKLKVSLQGVCWVGEHVFAVDNVEARVLDLNGEHRFTWPMSFGPMGVAVDQAGESVVVAGVAGNMIWLDPRSGDLLGEEQFKSLRITAYDHHPSEPRVAVGAPNGVTIVELSREQGLKKAPNRLIKGDRETPVEAVAYSPDGRRLLVGRGYKGMVPLAGTGVELWDLASGKRVSFLRMRSKPRGLLWLSDGRAVAGTSEGRLYLLSAEGELEHRFEGGPKTQEYTEGPLAHAGPIGTTSSSAQGLLVTGGNRREGPGAPWVGELHAWDLQTNRAHDLSGLPAVFRPGRAQLKPMVAVSVRGDGRRFLIATSNRLQVWSLIDR